MYAGMAAIESCVKVGRIGCIYQHFLLEMPNFNIICKTTTILEFTK
jgi:hypothetical protein